MHPLFVSTITPAPTKPRFASGLLETSFKPCPPVACLFLVDRITRTTCHILTHLSVGRTMLMVAHHHPVVVATTSSDSVTLAGCWARIALAGSGAAAMPEVGRSPCRGGQRVPTTLPPVQCHPTTYCKSTQKGRTKPNLNQSRQNNCRYMDDTRGKIAVCTYQPPTCQHLNCKPNPQPSHNKPDQSNDFACDTYWLPCRGVSTDEFSKYPKLSSHLTILLQEVTTLALQY